LLIKINYYYLTPNYSPLLKTTCTTYTKVYIFRLTYIVMKIKKCAGAVIYNSEGKIFLMTSPKWNKYVIPGGKIENGETKIEALKREIKEELGIEITDIVKISESIKKPSPDFKDPTLTFHFVSFSAKALQTKIIPNEEISEYGWYTIEEALKLPLVDSTESLIKKYIELKNHLILDEVRD